MQRLPERAKRLYYTSEGDPKHPPILFLHGFMGSGEDWAEIVAALKDRFYCLSVDLPGHGRSADFSPELPRDMPHTAAAVMEVVKALPERPAYLVGYSMGGRLALYVALHYPQHFAGVVLESASPGLKTAAERAGRIHRDEQLARRLEGEDFAAFLEAWYRQPLFASLGKHPRYPELIARRLRTNPDPRALARALREMGTGRQPSLWDELPRMKMPLLLVVGENDPKFSALAREMAARCPTAQVAVIKDAGHNVHFEQPEVFARTVAGFANDSQSPDKTERKHTRKG
ncbi:MAG: 2-succinyl-6-hydroxy-2,4-cyclohexadiene-1-carboxylate synthase [Calditrichaeota bacterium]|nr:MAG: 2-succinyl-6-hydroxy-2,4-cyclohexadiene-1-carboxylate synthase [Calditrichota bacterium]